MDGTCDDGAAGPQDSAERSAELDRVRRQLADERDEFRAALAAGAAELSSRDKDVAALQARAARLEAQRDRARAKVRLYEKSRVVRLAGKVVLGVRRLRRAS